MVRKLEQVFELKRLLGAGGMGMVYEAWDATLERRVAIKLLHPHLTLDKSSRDRLLHEARLAARIEHARIVRVYGIQEHEGQLAIEMQYIEGVPLHRILEHGPIPLHQAAHLMSQVLEALDACHAQGVVHCDLKPGNILVTAPGHIFLTDFGISRALYSPPDGESQPTATFSGLIWGTPQYCPPEAWEGGAPTPQWDLYALGVMVHEALVGRLPFSAQTPAMLMREKLERPPAALCHVRPDVTSEFGALVDALKAKNPDDRPKTARASLHRLQSLPEYRDDTAITIPLAAQSETSVAPIPTHPFGRLNPSAPTQARKLVVPGKSIRRRIFGGFLLASVLIVALLLAGRPWGFGAFAPSDSIGRVDNLKIVDGIIYFSYDDGLSGRELWHIGSSRRAEIVQDIFLGSGSSNPRNLFGSPSGRLLFAATSHNLGEELWACNRRGEAWLLKDIFEGPIGSFPFPLLGWNDSVLFYAKSLHNDFQYHWTDGTQEHVLRLLDGDGYPMGMEISPKFARDDAGAYIIARGGRVDANVLSRYTYADNSVSILQAVKGEVGEMIVFQARLYMVLKEENTGSELWYYDENTKSLECFADLWGGPDSSDPKQLFVWKDRLYFQAESEKTGVELWCSDGTPEGTYELADVAKGPASSSPGVFFSAGDKLVFRANDHEHGDELFITDGTQEGTELAADVWRGESSSHPYNVFVLKNRLFFSANDGENGEELYVTDLKAPLSSCRLVADLWPGATGSEPHDAVIINEDTAAFIYKTPDGDGIMILGLTGRELLSFQLEPLPGLIAHK